MTATFSHIYATSKTDGTKDPSTELFTWLSHRLTDWASRCGENYVRIVDNHVNWEAAGITKHDQNTDSLTISLQLIGAEMRSQTIPDSLAHGLRIVGNASTSRYRSTSYIYNWRGIRSRNDQSNGSSSYDASDQLSSSRGVFHIDQFQPPSLSYCIYQEDDNAKFFAYNLLSSSSGTTTTSLLLIEIDDPPLSATGWDFGWAAIGTDFRINSLTSGPPGTPPWSGVKSCDINAIEKPYMRSNVIAMSQYGFYTGNFGDRLLYGPNAAHLETVTLDSKNYIFIGSNRWVKIS